MQEKSGLFSTLMIGKLITKIKAKIYVLVGGKKFGQNSQCLNIGNQLLGRVKKDITDFSILLIEIRIR